MLYTLFAPVLAVPAVTAAAPLANSVVPPAPVVASGCSRLGRWTTRTREAAAAARTSSFRRLPSLRCLGGGPNAVRFGGTSAIRSTEKKELIL